MKSEKLRELSEIYGLVGSDFHMQKYGNKEVPFMKKSGIDKIQAIENIEVDFEPIEALCVPGEHVALKVKAKWGDNPIYQTIGEASKQNCRVSYLACMAEKRGRGRAILNLTGFANEGVFSKDDMWQEDEQQS